MSYDLKIHLRGIHAVLTALAVTCALAASARANEDDLELKCRSLLHRYVFNCGCTTEFLEQHLNTEQAEIVLQLWALGVNGDESRHELINLYLQHGRKTIDEAVMKFHAQRDRLRVYCAQGDGPMIAD